MAHERFALISRAPLKLAPSIEARVRLALRKSPYVALTLLRFALVKFALTARME